MTEQQKYLFDVTGYLVVENILPLDSCKQLIDSLQEVKDTPKDQLPIGVRISEKSCGQVGISDLTSIGPIFSELIDIPKVIDILKVIIHNQLRLEVSYALVRKKGFSGLKLHGGGEFDSNGQDITLMYRHFNGRIFSGNTVVAFNLTDVKEEEGGFVCIPGSHKANFPIPREMQGFKDGKVDTSLLRSVPCKSGSAIIFTEALSHGAAPWNNETERVTLFYKYHHPGMKFRPYWPPKESLERMTPAQRAFYSEVSSDSRHEPVFHPGRDNSGPVQERKIR